MSSNPTPSIDAPVAPAPNAPADCGEELKRRFPALFGGGAKPLKLKIQTDIQERAPGVFSKQQLSAFFRRYTGSTSYLIAMTRSPHRFDLDGNPSGEISEEHRKVAADELARRRASHQAKQEQVEDARRKRAALLRDFEATTLTPANFCALKGIAPQALDALLETARREAQEHAPQREGRPPRHEAGDRRDRPDRSRSGMPRRDGAPRPPKGPGR
ncbi:MAG TPA: ProQ/FinO family protein [Albitalea sp.]|nr:ProQ/FinO family protein [Albitalea sp.]